MGEKALPINLELLKWAREQAGLSYEDVADLGGIKPLKARKDKPEVSGPERVQAWEEGILPLSWRQVERLAKVYRRPALTFFLKTPPLEEAKVADFRTVGDASAKVNTPEFAAFLRRIDVLHQGIIDLVGVTKTEKLPFLGSVTTETPANETIASIRKWLDFPYSEQEKQTTEDDLLRAVRRKIQEVGIFVLFEGDLGSYHSQISPEEFRGIAVCHSKAPLIVVNPYDAKAARLFTLIHELTHLWLGDSAISNASVLQGVSVNHKPSEMYCNKVAAEFLVPQSALISTFSGIDVKDVAYCVPKLARKFHVSRAVVARRLYELDKIDNDTYWSYFNILKEQWRNNKRRIKKREGGPDKNILDRYRLGDKIIRTVLGGVTDGYITLQDASRILKVKVARFDAIL